MRDAVEKASVFARARWATALAVLLAGGSMAVYPGGTQLGADSIGYDLARNFLSDLGATVAFNGEPNVLGSTLFVASLGFLLLGLGTVLFVMLRFYATVTKHRPLVRGVAALGLLTIAAFVGVAMTPENRAMDLHVQFTLLAFRILPLVALLLTLVTWSATALPARVRRGWLLLTVALTLYVAILEWGPSPSSKAGLTTMVVAQKTIVLLAILMLLYQAHAVERHADV